MIVDVIASLGAALVGVFFILASGGVVMDFHARHVTDKTITYWFLLFLYLGCAFCCFWTAMRTIW